MQTVGIKDLKNNLSSYIDLTKSGHTIVITQRGRPVALLRPVDVEELDLHKSVEERLGLLAKKGLIRMPISKTRRPFHPVRIKGELVSSAILEDRE